LERGCCYRKIIVITIGKVEEECVTGAPGGCLQRIAKMRVEPGLIDLENKRAPPGGDQALRDGCTGGIFVGSYVAEGQEDAGLGGHQNGLLRKAKKLRKESKAPVLRHQKHTLSREPRSKVICRGRRGKRRWCRSPRGEGGAANERVPTEGVAS